MSYRLADIIRDAREARGLTQEEFAELIGMSQEWVTKTENGHNRNPRMSTIRRIADRLGETVDMIVLATDLADTADGAKAIAAKIEESIAPDDPRERLIARIRALPRLDRIDWALEFAVKNLENDPALKHRNNEV